MKRSFKVATVFAGVGAATGAFAPAALAAPAHGTAAAKPAIGPWQECGANNGGVSNWVHIYYPNDDHPAECIGGAGFTYGKATVFSLCPGNNDGVLHGSVSGVGEPALFWPGGGRKHISKYDGYRGAFHLTSLSIHSWSGHAKC